MRVSFISTAALVFSAPADAGSNPFADAPILPLDNAAPASPAKRLPKAPRKPRAAKPVADTAPVTAEPAADVTPVVTAEPAAEPAPRVAPIARTCATIARAATNFGGILSDRDLAYIAFFASFAKAASDGIVTIRAIVDSGRVPAYGGSAKPHDAGVVNRLRKAGIITVEADGTSFAFTPRGTSEKAYAAA